MNLKQFNPMKILNHWKTLNEIVSGKNPAPISCEIDPSNYCNHDCIWCINGNYRENNLEMLSKERLFSIIDQLADMRVKSITFTGGGEPLTNPAVLDALKKVRRGKMETALVTNGSLLDEEKSKVIINTCSFVRISLDAAGNNIYNKLHRPKGKGKKNFDKVISNLKTLVELRRAAKKKTTIGVAYLVHPLNYHQIYDAAKLVKKIGVDYIQVRPVFMGGAQLSGKIWFETERLMQDALGLRDKSFHVFPILHRFDEVINMDKGYDVCRGHRTLGVIGANGKVYLCCQFRGVDKFCFGDLNKQTFKEIWNGRKRQLAIKNISLDKCPPCRYNKYNELLDYLADKERPHKNFL